jgi:hypothetical protein
MQTSITILCSVFILTFSHINADLSLSFTLLEPSTNQDSLESCSVPPKLWLCALCIDAVESGNLSAIKEYLKNQTLSEQLIYGVDFEDGETALIKAAMKNHVEV